MIKPVHGDAMEADHQCGYICEYIAPQAVGTLAGGGFREADRHSDQAFRLSAKPYKVSDGGGLFLWVTPSGGKIWRWTYRYECRAKLMTFGSYPDVPLSLARERHAAARKLLATGTDPMAERKAEKAAGENSFQSIGLAWWQHWQEGMNQRHALQVKRRMEADILPRLGARPIAAIEAPELVTMTKAIRRRAISSHA